MVEVPDPHGIVFIQNIKNSFWRTYLYTRPWATSDTIVESLKLQIHMECFQSSLQTYTRCLRTFMCCVWAAGSIIMPLSNLLFAQILGLSKNPFFTPGYKWYHCLVWLRLHTHLECFQPSFQTNTWCLKIFICCVWGARSIHAINTTLLLAQI